ncbi:hypothetical protein K402DRAFT_398013 [Aulographum hederae CBS 113979]|uniref:DDE-domain-containing protein n=1 Tax=Aulographum hederae CBS 113979 TaxID=1176131 RepID=A0A6G1GMM1_9PEZI|nr:hypothetical protein K402DRAFT_398013 [Aulographum hederae CBS 113979]
MASGLCGTFPGKDWVPDLVARHTDRLATGFLDGFDLSRKKADNAYEYQRFFELISAKIVLYDIQPENTYNMDEKGFLIGALNKARRVYTSTNKPNGAGQDRNRAWIAIIAAICQDGTSLPPAIIYQGMFLA